MTHTDAKINALIATKVMGWHETDSVWHLSQRRGWAHADGEGECVLADWHPLTDPAQAVRALEVFCKAHSDIEVALSYDLSAGWSVGFLARSVDTEPWGADDASFCRAVCMALLEAVRDD
jgi:hypothetical protein